MTKTLWLKAFGLIKIIDKNPYFVYLS